MTYLANIIELLQSDDFYGVSESIEIAKGKYERPYTWRKGFTKIKRHIKWKI